MFKWENSTKTFYRAVLEQNWQAEQKGLIPSL